MVEGYVEVLRPFQIRGWASDPEAPGEAVRVTLRIDGVVVCEGIADGFRPDLLEAGVGDGQHGFILNFDQPLPAGRHDAVIVEARSSASVQAIALPQIPGLAVIDTARPAAPPPKQISPVTGFYAVASSLELTGWAFDAARPDDHVAIVVEVDGRPFGTAVADRFRPDLLVAMVGSGDHGFTVRFNQPLPLENLSSVAVNAVSQDGTATALTLLKAADADVAAMPAMPTQAVVQLSPPLLDQDPAQRPVFILGAARSGTSAIAQALMATTRYVGHEEGHLLDLIGPLFGAIRRHYDERADEWRHHSTTLISAVPEAFWQSGVKRLYVDLARALFPAGWWLDKTPRPGMVAVAPLLRQIWPEARFIFMKRRGIENIASRRRKFPAMSFEAHCRDWSLVMQTWMTVRQELAGAAIEIDQLCLATDPARVSNALTPMLLLQPHEAAGLARALASDRPERTSARFAETMPLSATDWTSDEKQAFMETCGGLMESCGYGTGSDYFADRAEGDGIDVIA